MGKIFGISDLPVSTIMTPFEPIRIPQTPTWEEKEYAAKIAKELGITQERYTPKALTKARVPKFLDMRNGIGELMKHFSKKA